MTLSPCHDCGAKPGQLHADGCDVERCPRCGGQAISCFCIYEINGMDEALLETEHPDIYTGGPTDEMQAKWNAEWGQRRLPWTGIWPGEAECIEFGWYSRDTASGWQPCGKDDPGASPDLNRLYAQATWDAAAGRFVLRH